MNTSKFVSIVLRLGKELNITDKERKMCEDFLNARRNSGVVAHNPETYILNNFQDAVRRKYPDEYKSCFD